MIADTIGSELDGMRRKAWVVGVVVLIACAVGGAFDPPAFFRAYLFSYLYWAGLPLGALAILMVHHLDNGRWGFVVQRLLESAARTLPVIALLFLPLLLGLRELYPWARPEAATDALIQHKQVYLNLPFFIGRAVLYFAVWLITAFLLTGWSFEQDRTGDPALVPKMRALSAAGLVLYGLTMTFAAVDWVMSTEPHWFSTVFGLIFLMGQCLAALAFVVVVGVLLSGRRALAEVLSSPRLHDLGNLLLAFVMLWAYMAFSQWLVTWMGNLPDEIRWYLHRTEGGWRWLAMGLSTLYFGLPFLLLLMRTVTGRGRALLAVSVLILGMRIVDLFWMVIPSFHPGAVSINWLDVLLPIGLGGIWLGTFVWQLQGRPLLPLHDPRFQSVAHVASPEY